MTRANRSDARKGRDSRLNLVPLEARDVPAVAFALTGDDQLVSFDTSAPQLANAPIAITGQAANENFAGIDIRPQNGMLYGLAVSPSGAGSAVRLYAISTQTGVATPLTATPQTFTSDLAGTAVPVAGANFGFDFNPSADRARVVSNAGVNFRINPNTGLIVDGDGATDGVQPDAAINGGGSAGVEATAYSNSSPSPIQLVTPAPTTQYTLDSTLDTLFIQNDPNSGAQTLGVEVTLGGSKLDFTAVNGFDIPAGVNALVANGPAVGSAFAALTVGGANNLYSVELATGVATLIGAFAAPASGLAVQSEQPGTVAGTPGVPVVGFFNQAGVPFLTRFLSSSPADGQISQAITGIAATETLVGIDFRPATGQLFGLAVDFDATEENGTLYVIDPQTRVATPVGTSGAIAFTTAAGAKVDFPDPATAGYGFDFNPTVDRIRVTTSNGLNFRLNPTNGTPVDGNAAATGTQPDAAINGAPGVTGATATAYTNSFGQALPPPNTPPTSPTTQYVLDAATDSLYIQNPPNGGTLTNARPITLNGAPLDFTDVAGFDIPANVRTNAAGTAVASGFGLAALTVGTSTSLYRINLVTGEATSLGTVGGGVNALSGIAVGAAPAGAVGFVGVTNVRTAEGGTAATLTLARSGGTSGQVTVALTATGGTGTAADFSSTPVLVTFADGQTTATVTLTGLPDNLTEGDESVTFALTDPTSGLVLSANNTATLTITDAAPVGIVQFSTPTFTVNENGTSATITVTRTGGTAGPFTVDLAVTGGTATPGTDFGTVPTTVTFADGQTEATVTIPVTSDTQFEGDETVVLTLSNPTNNATLGTQATTTLTIVETTPPRGAVAFSSPAFVVGENGTTAIVTLTRTGGTVGTFAVTLGVAGTATAGTDFGTVPTTVTFADGQTQATVSIPITNDTLTEGDETIVLTLSAPTEGATLGAPATATLTIVDDESVPPAAGAIAFSAPTFAVGENGGTATVTLTRIGGTAGAVTVSVRVTGGTATAGSDFGTVPATVSFAAGQATATLTIPITNDTLAEADETLLLALSNPTGGAILGAQSAATLTVIDNDSGTGAGAVAFSSATYTIAEGVGTAQLTLVRTGGSTGAVTVTVSVTGGTATATGDFGTVPATVTFADGQATATLSIPVVADTLGEDDETIVLTISAPTGGATLGTPATATVTLTDDDDATPTPFLIGGGTAGAARLLTGTGGTFALGAGVTFPGITGNARVAVADVTGDGIADYVGGNGPGEVSRVVVIDGATGKTVASFAPFESTFTGGVYVAAGDLDGDGKAEVVVTPDQGGGPVVAVYKGSLLAAGQGATSEIRRFFGIEDPNFRGGARPALGDIDGDGAADLVVSAGFQGGPRVAVFDGSTLAAGGSGPRKLVSDFFVFESTLRNGAFVAAGDVDGDGFADLAFGGGPNGGPRVRLVDGPSLLASKAADPVNAAQFANFFAGDSALRGGVRVALRDADGDGRADLLTGSGTNEPSRVRLFRAGTLLASATPSADQEFDPFGATLSNGVFVG